ncbi:lysylphosphatidylglycerol synthase domain-containing protein [Rhizobium sp. RU36D]|uniref:lysylphosphatidylglycerol synthase domain-containing protein n=1 Tax=Rhizobium sp. RU36D TaxID=1907415 RepID=UPI0009D7D219|nr:lysylphosphatidylglycerol synthase domain-containing protein [Rhizobium sp. RU36D]SMD14562.1 Uncharacterized membrane protein YbhN, UPF0104 family [Rhizobium sp. RU36D]
MKAWIWRYWPALLAVACCWLAYYQFNWNDILPRLPLLPIGSLLLVMSVTTILVFVCGALRWIAVSQLPWRLDVVGPVYCYVAFAQGISIVTPFQLGELVKIKFAQSAGLKMGSSAINVASERLLDVFTMLAMGMAGLVYLQTGLAWFSTATLLAIALMGLATPQLLKLLVAWLGDRSFGRRLQPFSGPALPLANLLTLGLLTFIKWGATLASWLLIFHLVDVNLNVWQGCFLVGASTAIMLMSMVPGGIGVLEVSIRALLIGIGIDDLHAETAAIALRLFTPVMLLIGLAHLPFLQKRARPAESKNSRI